LYLAVAVAAVAIVAALTPIVAAVVVVAVSNGLLTATIAAI